jgi:hypothetical protein
MPQKMYQYQTNEPKPLAAPLKGFAERLVRNGEVKEFIRGLIIEHEVDVEEMAREVGAEQFRMELGKKLGVL